MTKLLIFISIIISPFIAYWLYKNRRAIYEALNKAKIGLVNLAQYVALTLAVFIILLLVMKLAVFYFGNGDTAEIPQ